MLVDMCAPKVLIQVYYCTYDIWWVIRRGFIALCVSCVQVLLAYVLFPYIGIILIHEFRGGVEDGCVGSPSVLSAAQTRMCIKAGTKRPATFQEETYLSCYKITLRHQHK